MTGSWEKQSSLLPQVRVEETNGSQISLPKRTLFSGFFFPPSQNSLSFFFSVHGLVVTGGTILI